MSLIRFPGLIDAHVHLRDPGATQKEDFYTASRAAIAGGFTYIIDMPNNPIPIISEATLQEKINLVKPKNLPCDIGFYFGTDGKNLAAFSSIQNNADVFGLKIYLNITTGTLLIDDDQILEHIFAAWNSDKPILVHAIGKRVEQAIYFAEKYQRRLHVCHVTLKTELEYIRKAKMAGMDITCGVTPHHLFLTQNDVNKLGPYGLMKPEIESEEDQTTLWGALLDGTIDIVESDHAPHTKKEKESNNPPYGVPGLETTLGLMLLAVHRKLITIDQVKMWLYDQPQKIFSIPQQNNTYIEFDPDIPYTIGADGYMTKCGWSPFDGWEGYGKVVNVVKNGKQILRDNDFVYD
jgi:dihydroorotase-like cyclic amidohydrolase